MSRRWLTACGAIAIAGHLVGIVADLYSGYTTGVDASLGSIVSLNFENVAPLFRANSLEDAMVGHYLAIAFIPLGAFGIWQIFVALKQGSEAGSLVFILVAMTTLICGTFYHGTLAFMTGAMRLETDAPELLSYFNTLSEPLGRVLLIGNPLASAVFASVVALRRTPFPRWFALWNPVAIQLGMSFLIAVAPYPADLVLWLTVFNSSFALWYAGTTFYILRQAPVQNGGLRARSSSVDSGSPLSATSRHPD